MQLCEMQKTSKNIYRNILNMMCFWLKESFNIHVLAAPIVNKIMEF